MDLGFAVMDRAGVYPKDTVGREGWTAIKCASKRSYGCGKSGNSAVQDLDLLLYHGDLEDLSSSLSVRAGDKVFLWVDKEIAAKGGRPAVQGEKDRYFRTKVEIVDKGLIVVTLCFSQYGGFDYYLVFDSVDSSLSMIPYIPDWASCYTTCPLPLLHDGGYSLVLLGSKFGCVEEGGESFLWQWSPSLAGSPGGSSDPWQIKKLRFPIEMKDPFFTTDVVFSFSGWAFWTDLARGTLCCDCSAVLWGGYLVNFTFIDLPPGYQNERDVDTSWVKVYRTMGCVGGSIKFVSIDEPNRSEGGGTCVKVWTLIPSRGEWKLCSDFRLKSLRKDFKGAGLPKSLPMWPMLREQEGANLYFILAGKTKTRDGGRKHYICRLDMPTKRFLQSKLLTHTSLVQGPVILPSDFFEDLDLLPSRLEPILMEG